MPLSKSITDQSGVVSTYWVITNANADFINQVVSVQLSGYLDQNAYVSGKQPSARRGVFFTIPFADLPSIASAGTLSMADLYTEILAKANIAGNASPLAGATEVA